MRHFRLKSAPAKVVRARKPICRPGRALGSPNRCRRCCASTTGVGCRRGFSERCARRRSSRGLAWRFWTFNWEVPAAGEHRVTSTCVRHRRQLADRHERRLPRQQSDLLGDQRAHHAPGSHSLIATTVAIGRSEAGGHRIGAAAARYRPRDRTLVACGQAVDPRDTEGELVRARLLLRRDHRRCLVAVRQGMLT